MLVINLRKREIEVMNSHCLTSNTEMLCRFFLVVILLIVSCKPVYSDSQMFTQAQDLIDSGQPSEAADLYLNKREKPEEALPILVELTDNYPEYSKRSGALFWYQGADDATRINLPYRFN